MERIAKFLVSVKRLESVIIDPEKVIKSKPRMIREDFRPPKSKWWQFWN